MAGATEILFVHSCQVLHEINQSAWCLRRKKTLEIVHTNQKSKEVGSRDANTAKSVEFVHFYPRFELPLNMNSLSDLGPVDFLSRYNLMIIAIMKGSLR